MGCAGAPATYSTLYAEACVQDIQHPVCRGMCTRQGKDMRMQQAHMKLALTLLLLVIYWIYWKARSFEYSHSQASRGVWVQQAVHLPALWQGAQSIKTKARPENL
eukprot:1159621-Pelagomonas_calceolata.AAC.8